MDAERLRSPGGTSGGLGMFLLGLVLAVAGAYLLIDRVVVHTTGWGFFGLNSFGLSLVPFLLGIFLLFVNGRSIIGWLLTLAGVIIIFAGILANLSIFFRPTSLFSTLVMLVLLVGGLGLIVKALRTTSAP
jgi:hypothetical protein